MSEEPQDTPHLQTASVVYILTNQAMPGLVKIGMTGNGDPSQRMSQLYSTGVPYPFECEMAVALPDDQTAARVEDSMHRTFAPHRVNPRREFFDIPVGSAMSALSMAGGVDVTESAQRKMDANIQRNEKDAARRARGALLVLSALGIRNGEDLEYIGVTDRDHTTATVADAARNTLLVDGREMSLKDATVWFGGENANSRPARDWTHNGDGLVDLYERTRRDAR